MSDALEGAAPIGPEDAARAVFAALALHLPKGEIEEVKQMVPEGVRELFPQS